MSCLGIHPHVLRLPMNASAQSFEEGHFLILFPRFCTLSFLFIEIFSPFMNSRGFPGAPNDPMEQPIQQSKALLMCSTALRIISRHTPRMSLFAVAVTCPEHFSRSRLPYFSCDYNLFEKGEIR